RSALAQPRRGHGATPPAEILPCASSDRRPARARATAGTPHCSGRARKAGVIAQSPSGARRCWQLPFRNKVQPICPMAAHCQKFGDRKSTRLNSSHVAISYAVFCLKKKKLIIATETASVTRSGPY